jgi:tRNA-splicing ligase RtcB
MKGSRASIKAWTHGVDFDQAAIDQVKNVASLPFIHGHVAVMPDVHFGRGATVGSVIPTRGAIIPAAVGVDIGCGMVAARTSLSAARLPDSLSDIRADIEAAVPVGFAQHAIPSEHADEAAFNGLAGIVARHPAIGKMAKNVHEKVVLQSGTLGGGNHFIELCLDTEDRVWVMLHSGSRGIGNIIGRYFIEVAKEDMRVHHVNLPDRDLSYLSEGTEQFADYVEAVGWAQNYARSNRDTMMALVLDVLAGHLPEFSIEDEAINCHHNYVQQEMHFGENVWLTRKGAVSARKGQLGIIPGSMGERSFIVRGKGNADSFSSCSHGAGRVMSRGKAKKATTVADHVAATEGVECRKDRGVLDESPSAYKDIDAVMNAQKDLVDVVHTLKQVLCVKG